MRLTKLYTILDGVVTLMKCHKCNSEWMTTNQFSNIENCPFCGESLNRVPSIESSMTLGKVINIIIERFGIAFPINS